MDLTEKLYKKYIAWRNRRKINQVASTTVHLSEIISKLTFIARALTGIPIEIASAEREGGWKDNRFFLPVTMNLYEDLKTNFSYYIFRTFYLAGQKKLQLNWQDNKDRTLEESRLAALKYSSKVVEAITKDFTNFSELHYNLLELTIDTTWLYGKWMKPDIMYSPESLHNISDLETSSWNDEIATELEAKGVEELISLHVDKKSQEDFTLTHNFEKIETIEEFNDIWRDFDGDDSLGEDLDALDTLNLKHTVRVDDVVHSVYKSDFGGQITVAESRQLKDHGFHYSYPEWHTGIRAYKEDHCKVFPLLFKSIKSKYAHDCIKDNANTVSQLKKTFSQLFNANSKVRRVESGDEFDIDAITDMYADIFTRVTPDDRIYVSKRRKKKELSLLFLLDLSLSGDSYVRHQRVIDIEKQAVISLGEVFSDFDVEFQIDGFFFKNKKLLLIRDHEAFQ